MTKEVIRWKVTVIDSDKMTNESFAQTKDMIFESYLEAFAQFDSMRRQGIPVSIEQVTKYLLTE